MLKINIYNLLTRTGVLLAGLLFLSSCSEQNTLEKEMAPDFTLELFKGGKFELDAHRGKPILINFLASWCIPCREEIPILNRTYSVYKHQGISFLAIAVADTEKNMRKFVKKFNLSLPTGIDASGEIKDAYGFYGIPTTIFIDKKGLINYLHPGSVTESLVHHELGKLL